MVRKPTLEVRENMRGGSGEVIFEHIVPKEELDGLIAAVTELTGGRFSHRLIGEEYAPLTR